MLRPGWIEQKLQTAVLMLAAGALTGCGTLGGGSSSTASGAASAANPAAPSPELEARYATILSGVRAGDVTALSDLATFSAENPELAGPLLNLGLARAREGDETGARALFERATRVCSHCGPVWNELGVLDRQQGRFAEAEKAYQQAIELEPGYAPAYYNLAMLYELYIPRPDLALENYERYLQMDGAAGEGQDVEKWVGDLRRRVSGTPKSARAEEPT